MNLINGLLLFGGGGGGGTIYIDAKSRPENIAIVSEPKLSPVVISENMDIITNNNGATVTIKSTGTNTEI